MKAARTGDRTGVVAEPDAALSKTRLERIYVSESLVGGHFPQQLLHLQLNDHDAVLRKRDGTSDLLSSKQVTPPRGT